MQVCQAYSIIQKKTRGCNRCQGLFDSPVNLTRCCNCKPRPLSFRPSNPFVPYCLQRWSGRSVLCGQLAKVLWTTHLYEYFDSENVLGEQLVSHKTDTCSHSCQTLYSTLSKAGEMLQTHDTIQRYKTDHNTFVSTCKCRTKYVLHQDKILNMQKGRALARCSYTQ
jgi:hypothetical protein